MNEGVEELDEKKIQVLVEGNAIVPVEWAMVRISLERIVDAKAIE